MIRALVKGWKIRKILKTRTIKSLKVGIQDLINLKNELQIAQNHSLLYQVTNQIPIMKSKMIKEIHKFVDFGN